VYTFPLKVIKFPIILHRNKELISAAFVQSPELRCTYIRNSKLPVENNGTI
jgi:hypothetical protein